jgi:MYXO-CTERM domain-containing protein
MEREIQKSARWEKFTHALMATTCLTVGASGMASGTTMLIVEGTSPAPSDFPNTAPGYLLPLGTNVVQGQLTNHTDTDDYFEFQGLSAGRSFSIIGVYNPLHQEQQVSFTVFNSQGTQLGNATLEGQGGLVLGTIPNDGELIVQVNKASGKEAGASYQINLTAEVAAAPEPAPIFGAALGLAGALAWRRRRTAKAN